MVAVLETWTLVVGRGLDWVEVLVSGGGVNLDKDRKKKTEKDTSIFTGWSGWTTAQSSSGWKSSEWTQTARMASLTG